MIFLVVTVMLLIGSAAATDTTDNDINNMGVSDSLSVSSTSSMNTTGNTATATTQNKINSSSTSSKTINSITSSTTSSSTGSSLNNSSTASSISSGTKSIKSSSSSTNLTTKTSVTSVTGSPGKTVTLKAVIRLSNGTYVKNGTVAFKINGKTIGQTSVSGGGAKLNYTIPSSFVNTKYTITAVYGGNSVYASSKSNGNLTLTPNTSTKVSVNKLTAYAGQNVLLKATVKTSSNVGVTSGKVAFKINGKTVGYGSVSNGVATLNYTIPTSYKDSTYTITVVYGGNGKYITSRSNGVLSVYQRQATSVTVSSIASAAGKTVTLIGTVKTSGGAYVKNGTVAFKINGKTVGYANVSGGVAKLNYNIPSNFRDASYTITVVYGENNYYNSNKANGTLRLSNSANIIVPAGYEKYVVSTSNCNIKASNIQSLANSILNKMSGSSTLSVAKYIFTYINSITSYSGYYNTRYGASKTLSNRYGNCVDLAHLVIAVTRACNIPARYCHATCYFRSGLVTGHVWAEVYVGGTWYKCDASSKSNTFGSTVNWRTSGSVTRYISLPF
ncbi:Ig-like domain repeat protein [Methanosphaera sp. WGK6]|uniref:Ig-like domain repeat protein n=1 Tax=Methanosphaera sp. WGK6 TaxID=1561964 RepID=UPI00084C7AB5|nr:Ig-like domain repeat protein [Methanosphaera sp. WGK6]